MRLRIRSFGSQTHSVDTSETTVTIDDLKTELFSRVPELTSPITGNRREFELSLNRQDVIGETGATPLSELGIVDGDLLYILCSDPDLLNNQPQESNHQDQPMDQIPSSDHQTGNTDNQSNISDATMVTAFSMFPDHDAGGPEKISKAELSEIISCLNEPLRIRDSSDSLMPSIVSKLYKEAGVSNKTDALCVLLHALMLESGFRVEKDTRPTANEASCSADNKSDSSSSLPQDWKRTTSYVINYRHQSCDTVTCGLVCISIGQSLVAHAGLNGDDSHTLQLSPADFVNDLTPDGVGVYKRLNQLSRMFVDAISFPLQQDICTLMGYPNAQGFMALPYEIKLQILGKLDAASLLRLSEVCKDLYTICSDPFLWRRLFLVMFGARVNNDLNQNWKQFYIDEYRKRPSRIPVMPNFINPDNSVLWPYRPLPFPLRPPHFGIIGGEYDLRPFFDLSGPSAPNFPFGPRPRLQLPYSPLHPASRDFMSLDADQV